MFRIFAFFLLSLGIVSNVFSYAQEENTLAFERAKRESFAGWIQQNNKNLSMEKSIKIVDNVEYFSNEKELDPLFVFSMIKAESAFKPNATSRVGARGLMQVMPRWHKDKLRGRDPYAIGVNIEVGTKIIDDCLEKSKNNVKKALRCYSGGAGPHYAKRISNTHKELREQVRVLAILNDTKGVKLNKFEEPKIVSKKPQKDVLLAFMQSRDIR